MLKVLITCAHSFKWFVPVPEQRWVPGKMAAALVGFHDTLLLLAYEKSATQFENLPASVFHDFRGMTNESVKEAREQARNLGWVDYEVGIRGTYSYWLLDLEGQLVPAPEGSHSKGIWKFNREAWRRLMSKCQDRLLQPRGKAVRSGNDLAAKPEGQSPIDLAAKPEGQTTTSRQNRSHVTAIPRGGVPQVSEKTRITKSRPLSDKDSEEVKDSEGVVFESSSSAQVPTSDYEQQERDAIQNEAPALSWNDLNPNERPGKKRTREELRQDVETDPVVRRFQEKFGARIRTVIDLRPTKGATP